MDGERDSDDRANRDESPHGSIRSNLSQDRTLEKYLKEMDRRMEDMRDQYRSDLSKAEGRFQEKLEQQEDKFESRFKAQEDKIGRLQNEINSLNEALQSEREKVKKLLEEIEQKDKIIKEKEEIERKLHEDKEELQCDKIKLQENDGKLKLELAIKMKLIKIMEADQVKKKNKYDRYFGRRFTAYIFEVKRSCSLDESTEAEIQQLQSVLGQRDTEYRTSKADLEKMINFEIPEKYSSYRDTIYKIGQIWSDCATEGNLDKRKWRRPT